MDRDKFEKYSDLERERVCKLWLEYNFLHSGCSADMFPDPSNLITKMQDYHEIFEDELDYLFQMKKCRQTFEKLKDKFNHL